MSYLVGYLPDTNTGTMQNKSLQAESRTENKGHITPEKGSAIHAKSMALLADLTAGQTGAQDSVDGELQREESSADKPRLSPGQDLKNVPGSARILQLMAEFRLLNSAADEAGLQNAKALTLTTLQARKDVADQLSEELSTLKSEIEQAEGELSGLKGSLGELQAQLARKLAELGAARAALENLLGEGAAEDDPRVIAARNAVVAAEQSVGRVRNDILAMEQKITAASSALVTLMQAAQDKIAQVTVRFGVGGMMKTSPEVLRREADQQLSRIEALLAQMILMMGDSAVSKLQNDAELTKTLREANQAKMQKEHEKYLEEQRKAEQAAKTGNCISKILGIVTTIVGGALTVFGGAGAAVMAAGLFMMAADPIVEKLTGQSLTSRIFSPFMEHIFNPLMKLVSQVVAAVFEYTPLGMLLNAIDKATGAGMMDAIHGVISAVATAALLVGAAMLLKSGAQKLYEMFGKELLNMVMPYIKGAISSVVKQIPQATRQVASQIKEVLKNLDTWIREFAAGVGKKLGTTPELLAGRLQIMTVASQVAAEGTNAVTGIVAGKHMDNSAAHLRDSGKARIQMENWAEMLNPAEEARKNDEVMQLLRDAMMNATRSRNQAGLDILKQLVKKV